MDTEHHLIVAHEVINIGNDRGQLAEMSTKAKAVLGAEKLAVVADRGYFSSEEILACDWAGITVTLPKPMTSTAKARGRFGKQDFCYIADEDVYICPAGERLRADMGRKLCGYVYRNPDGTLEDGNEYVAADVFDVHEFSVKQYSLRRLTKRR